MRIPRIWLVLAIITLILVYPRSARADGHRAGLFFGFSAAQGSVLQGVNVSFDYVPKVPANKYLAVMVDFSAHETGRQIFTGGLSVSRRFSRVVVAAHGLAGGVWGDGSSDAAGTFGADFEVIAGTKLMGGKTVEFVPMARAD